MTWLPDINNSSDLSLSGLGGAFGYLVSTCLVSTRKSHYSALFALAGAFAGHKLFEHVDAECEKRKLLGG